MSRNYLRPRTALLCSFALAVVTTACSQVSASDMLQKQTASQADAVIEVAVVRPHPSSVMHNNFRFSRNRFELEDQPLMKLIAFAYSLNARQIVGAPGWISDDRYDMSGTTNLTADATVPQEQQLLRQLLKERFGLEFHREKREMPAYALRVVQAGPKLTTAADADLQPLEWTQGHDWERTENFRSSSMTDFIVFKQLFMDRPVVDETRLSGRYDFKLTYSYGDAPITTVDAAPTMFTAIKEQLGLKFEPVKAPIDIFVIDHIARPTAN